MTVRKTQNTNRMRLRSKHDWKSREIWTPSNND